MNSNATNPAASIDATAPPMGFFQRLTGIYFEPSKTFDDISRKRSWFGMYLVLVLVSIGASYTMMNRMDRETYADFEHQRYHFSDISRMQLQTQA